MSLSDLGLEYSSGGFITSIGVGGHQAPPSEHKFLNRTEIRGYATVYSKLHVFEGKLDYFLPGCFARSLTGIRAIRFLVQHDESKLIATSADRLELHSDDKGLAFRCDVTGDTESIEMIGDRRGMSVKYRIHVDELTEIDGYKIRLIKDAELYEISIGHNPIVCEAFGVIGGGTASRDLRELCESGSLMHEGAAQKVSEAINRLARVLA